MNSKIPFTLLSAIILTSCGDSVEYIYQTNMDVATSADDLPTCSEKNEGEQVFVKGEDATRICVDGKWMPVAPGNNDNDVSCKTEELKDKSGLKIICNGDSIGVVLNGKNGEKGEKGEPGESINESSADSLEKVTISGSVQKGPFLADAIITAYELQNGRSLKQTGATFGGKIETADGAFDIKTVMLSSSFAYIVADGFYRNEVTGENSSAAIKLRALTNLKGRSSANINLVTHLEYDRVQYLVTRKDSSVTKAKMAAEKELFAAFGIDNSDFKALAEDLNVLKEGDANAALLAISILLQGDRSESQLTQLLTNFSTDFTDGTWDDSTTKMQIADWAMKEDITGKLKVYRNNVASWGLSDTVPEFEKYIRNFWATEKAGTCSTENEDSLAEVSYQDKWATIIRCTQGAWSLQGLLDERDGQYYRTVKIGNQYWMAENLYFDYKIDKASYGSYAQADNGKTYGRYYTWAAAMDSAGIYSESSKGCGNGSTCTVAASSRGICPEGWHIPTNNEWDTLYSVMGSIPQAMQALGNENWGDATDSYAFTAFPAGYHNGGLFYYTGSKAYFWSATERNNGTADIWNINADLAFAYNEQKDHGLAIRCVKNEP